jgi:cyanophycinase
MRSNYIPRFVQYVLVALMMAPTASAQSPPAAEAVPQGRLLLIGGSERDNNAMIWDEVVRLSGGNGKSIAIFPTASSNPERTSRLYSVQMQALGLQPFVVPASPLLKDVDFHQIARDPQWAERVRQADAVFLAGGEQARYRRVLVNEDGTNTPLLEAIWHVYRKGGLVVGTSAGMAVMSRVMFVEADLILPVLLNGARMKREVDVGLGFAPKDWFVDQHFLTRGRFGRTLVAMQTYDFPFGLGVDEDTAVVIERGRTARVIGYRGALIVDASQAQRDPQEPRFHTRGVRLSFLSHDDQIDLVTREVTLGPEKKPEHLIDPYAPGFKPYYPYRQFYNDIFANTTVLEVMYKLVDGPFEDAHGLAFDGAAAKRQAETPGFEFRFYRTRESRSWESPTALGDPFTVQNVFLDIRPITVRGPLYE